MNKVVDFSPKSFSTAAQRLKPYIFRTPLVYSALLSRDVGVGVYLKLENLQRTGSFKIRGAMNKLLALSQEQRERGVIAVSTGNHGRAVADAARQLGMKAAICISENVPQSKRDNIAAAGAELIVAGASYDEAVINAEVLAEKRGLTFVHPFDDQEIIAGQGTIGWEILEDLPDLKSVVVPLSGGGLMAGVAIYLKQAQSSVSTIGITMDRSPVMHRSLEAGDIVELQEEPTIADALMGGLGSNNRFTFHLLQKYLDKSLLVSEEEILAAMAFCLTDLNFVVEGGGAVGIAAMRRYADMFDSGPVCVVVSGGNIAPSAFFEATAALTR